MMSRDRWEAQQRGGRYLGCIWGSSKLASPPVSLSLRIVAKNALGWKLGNKYITINRILLSLKILNAEQAFYALKSSKKRDLCHVLDPMVIFLQMFSIFKLKTKDTSVVNATSTIG
jgi:hypothetical protein